METEAKQTGERTSTELNKVAREEREFVEQALKQQLGREPTEDEVNEWLRKQTESC